MVGCLLRSGCRADHLSEEAQDNICNDWAALKLVRMAIEQTCPASVLPSEEASLLLYGPEPVHEGEALAKAIIETVNRLNSMNANGTPGAEAIDFKFLERHIAL